MRKTMLVLMFLAMTASLLGACHTVQGTGECFEAADRLTP